MRLIQYPDDMESKFKFIVVASQRCRQLQKGAKQRVVSRSKKFTTIAQEEVLAARVPYSDGELALGALAPDGTALEQSPAEE